jgi:hypothetical protein
MEIKRRTPKEIKAYYDGMRAGVRLLRKNVTAHPIQYIDEQEKAALDEAMRPVIHLCGYNSYYAKEQDMEDGGSVS